MVGVRIFWVGWGLMQHHDWEAGQEAAVTLCLVSGEPGRECYQVSRKQRRGAELLRVAV